jgi:GntR family transcriptional repressor for pyruvate dehydrogenase complex
MTQTRSSARAAVAKIDSSDAEDKIVSHVQDLIREGKLRPGTRLPAERDLAARLGVSRPSIRAGLGALQAMGVVRSRRGAGSYVTEGPPCLDSRQLHMLATLHGVGFSEIYEARRALEVEAAGLAAERATGDQLAAIAEEVVGLFSCLDQPTVFVVHDANFHRAVANATGNPILAALVGMIQSVFWDLANRRARPGQHLRRAAEFHRSIYHAIRDRDVVRARREMERHLEQGRRAQDPEADPSPDGTWDTAHS